MVHRKSKLCNEGDIREGYHYLFRSDFFYIGDSSVMALPFSFLMT